MPWMECSPMSQREEFVNLALSETVSVAELCRRFDVSRKTGYKWLKRLKKQADAAANHRPELGRWFVC